MASLLEAVVYSLEPLGVRTCEWLQNPARVCETSGECVCLLTRGLMRGLLIAYTVYHRKLPITDF